MKPLRIGILGGGPGGLYTAILLKNANPENQVTLIERNPAGATFGFGVVLSDRTLTAFQEADPKSFEQLAAHQSTWETIETIHRGVTVRTTGHYYLGIARKKLLDIFQKRAEELGVEMHFEQEEQDLSRFADCDLIVAADGVNSFTRKAYNEHFQATVVQSKSKFIWLAVKTVVPGFRFIFHDTEHGLFQAHMYPFDSETSTCIVQCRDETWEKAGLGKLDVDGAVAYCKNLLQPYLGDVEFLTNLTNRGLWGTFNMVTTKNWSYKNIVLLGDAVHTAHWNIGSGTKLAMEDAIALVDALKKHEDIPTALKAYQVNRKPAADRFQTYGRIGELYCENIDQKLHLDPIPFAFQFMVRTSRMEYDQLREKDPEFIKTVEDWFAKHTEGQAGVPVSQTEPIQTPVKIGSMLLPNRTVHVQPSTVSAVGGMPDSIYFAALKKLTQSGASLVLTDVVAASPDGRRTLGSPGIYTDELQEAWTDVVQASHLLGGALVGLQLGYVHAMGAELDKVKAAFVDGARRAAAAGFDLLQIDATQGSVLGAFLWPSTNQRRDQYGGDLAGRLRYPLEVISAVRAVWPKEMPLSVAVTIGDEAAAAEAVEVAQALKQAGCDLIQIDPAEHTSSLAVYGEQIRNEAGMPVIYDCRSGSAGSPNTLIAAERVDLAVQAVKRTSRAAGRSSRAVSAS